MRIIRSSSEEEMVLEFLRAELKSPRFKSKLANILRAAGLESGLITGANLHSQKENRWRKKILWAARPGMLKTLPKNVKWLMVLLSCRDWKNIKSMNQSDWISLFGQDRLVQGAATRLVPKERPRIYKRIGEISKELRAGKKLNPIILVTGPRKTKLVLLEGHVRATTYAYSGYYKKHTVPAILGVCKKPETWIWY